MPAHHLASYESLLYTLMIRVSAKKTLGCFLLEKQGAACIQNYGFFFDLGKPLL